MLLLQIKTGFSGGSAGTFSIRCPRCRKIGIFQNLAQDHHFASSDSQTYYVGQRMCPNPSCKLHLFVIADQHHNLVTCYPQERIDFDPKNVPNDIVGALEEAITCRAQDCFVAAAIMVRKTLELLCSAQGATGNNLKDRIKVLGAKAILPQELFAGLDDLRLLGNDAAHVESTVYAQVSSLEIDVAIEFTKEVLKAIYQLSDLLVRLQSLKRQSAL
jgi:hypothetical protein